MNYTDIQNIIRSFSLSSLATRYTAQPGEAIMAGALTPNKPIYQDAAKQPTAPAKSASSSEGPTPDQQQALDSFIDALTKYDEGADSSDALSSIPGMGGESSSGGGTSDMGGMMDSGGGGDSGGFSFSGS